jgi:PAS domain S-box-containing protein
VGSPTGTEKEMRKVVIMSTLNLRTKILLIVLGISIAAVAAMVMIVIFLIEPRLEEKLQKRGASIAHAVSSQCINPILTRNLFQLELFFHEFDDAEKDVKYLFVIAPDGAVTAHSFGKEFPVDLKTLNPRLNPEGRGIARVRIADRDIIDISVPLLEGSLGRLHVGMAAASIKTDVNEILESFGGIVILFFLSSLLILFFMEKWVIKPILEIKAVSVRVGNGELEERVTVSSGDEIGVLANEFNRMIDSFKESREVIVREKKLLARSEQRFRTIIEMSPISMAIISMDGTIDYINRRTVETFGYLPEDIPDMERMYVVAFPDEAYRSQMIAQYMDLVEKAIAGNREIERREYRVTCKDGTIKTMVIFGVPVSDKVFLMFEDITTRKLAEEEIARLNSNLEGLVAQRTEELSRINRDLASFCYAISHELRAPVGRIKGLSQALQEEWAENPGVAEYCAQRIEVASSELQRVIDSVLQLSRLSQSSFVPQPLNLSVLVREIAGSLVSETSDRQVEVIIADDITARGDLSLMRLCLDNLLGNAMKYTVHQPLPRIEFGRDAASGAFFIRDNGIGFDMAHADHLFEPFIRLHLEEEYAGSGIGLATVHRIIERHSGKIWAESSPGHGAAFYFTLAPSDGDTHDA